MQEDTDMLITMLCTLEETRYYVTCMKKTWNRG